MLVFLQLSRKFKAEWVLSEVTSSRHGLKVLGGRKSHRNKKTGRTEMSQTDDTCQQKPLMLIFQSDSKGRFLGTGMFSLQLSLRFRKRPQRWAQSNIYFFYFYQSRKNAHQWNHQHKCSLAGNKYSIYPKMIFFQHLVIMNNVFSDKNKKSIDQTSTIYV